MKEDKLLLNYMYLKGFTDEDMFDEHTIHSVRRSMAYSAYRMGLAFASVARTVIAAVKSAWEQIKPMLMLEAELVQQHKIIEPIRELPRPDYRRAPYMKDQVLNRKPSHQIRKIIR